MRDKVSGMASFLWEKKSAIGIGMMLAFAGRLGVDGCPLGRSNATDLSPLDWKGFNNLSHPSALEPLAHCRKLQENETGPTVLLRDLTVPTQNVKDAVNLPEFPKGDVEPPPIPNAALKHFKDLGMSSKEMRERVSSTDKVVESSQKNPRRIALEKKKVRVAGLIKGAKIDKIAAKKLESRMIAAHLKRDLLSTNTQNTQSVVFVHGYYFAANSMTKGSSQGQELAKIVHLSLSGFISCSKFGHVVY